jgi:hypothetical protein
MVRQASEINCDSDGNFDERKLKNFTTETQKTQRMHREFNAVLRVSVVNLRIIKG